MLPTNVASKRREGQIRCENCPLWFRPRSKGGSPQRFCSDTCRKQFNRNGSAYGKLRETLPGYIEKEVRKTLLPLEKLEDRMIRLLDRIVNLERAAGVAQDDLKSSKQAAKCCCDRSLEIFPETETS